MLYQWKMFSISSCGISDCLISQRNLKLQMQFLFLKKTITWEKDVYLKIDFFQTPVGVHPCPRRAGRGGDQGQQVQPGGWKINLFFFEKTFDELMIIWKVVHMVSAAKGAENFYTIEEHTTRSGDNLRINLSGCGFPYISFLKKCEILQKCISSC